MGNYTIFQMLENPRRSRQARNFTTNVPKILDLKSSSEQIFSENCRWVPLHCGLSVKTLQAYYKSLSIDILITHIIYVNFQLLHFLQETPRHQALIQRRVLYRVGAILKSFVRMKKMAFGDDRNVYRAPHGVMGSDCKGLGTKRQRMEHCVSCLIFNSTFSRSLSKDASAQLFL